MDYDKYRFLIVDSIKQSRDNLKQFTQSLGNVRIDVTAYVRDALANCQEVDYDAVLLGYDLGEKQKNGQQQLNLTRVEIKLFNNSNSKQQEITIKE